MLQVHLIALLWDKRLCWDQDLNPRLSNSHLLALGLPFLKGFLSPVNHFAPLGNQYSRNIAAVTQTATVATNNIRVCTSNRVAVQRLHIQLWAIRAIFSLSKMFCVEARKPNWMRLDKFQIWWFSLKKTLQSKISTSSSWSSTSSSLAWPVRYWTSLSSGRCGARELFPIGNRLSAIFPILTNCWCRLNSLNQLVGCGGSSGRALDLISKSCKFKSHPELDCFLWFRSSKNYYTMALWHCTMVWMTSKCQVLESYNLLMKFAVKSYS